MTIFHLWYITACDNSIDSIGEVPDIINYYKDVLLDDDKKALYWKMTAEYGRLISEATREWSQYYVK